MKLFKKHIDYLLLAVICIVAILPLLRPGFFPIHDDEQVGRLFELHQNVISMHIPPRLSQNLGFGYDYPLFNFYPSFVYYVSEVFVLLGFSFIDSIKLMIGLGFFLSALFMYLFAKEYWGRWGGLLAAAAYVYAPYHSVDVYVRGALPEFWSFVFVPAVFWTLTLLFKKQKSIYVIPVVLSMAGIILTHNLVAMMSAFFLLPYILFLLWKAKNKKTFTLQLAISGVLSFGLTAYFWIPAFFEKKFTMVDLLTTELANYSLHFVCVKQFLISPWGYGGSLLGCTDDISFQLGQVQLLLVFLAIVIGIVLFLKKKQVSSVFILFLLLFVFSLFIQLSYSKPLWDILQPFWYIQFPWRFLLFSAFTSSFLIGSLANVPLNKHTKNILFVVAIFIIVGSGAQNFSPQKYLTNAKDNDYTNLDTLRWRTSIMAFEYAPKGIITHTSPIGNTVISITKDQIAKKSFDTLGNQTIVSVIVDKPQEKKFVTKSEIAVPFQINVFSFPGWDVYINNKNVTYTDNNPFKLITIKIPPGENTILAKFNDTLIRKIANSISVVSGIMIICLFGYFLVRKDNYGKKEKKR